MTLLIMVVIKGVKRVKVERKEKVREEVTKLYTDDLHAPTASRETTAALGISIFT